MSAVLLPQSLSYPQPLLGSYYFANLPLGNSYPIGTPVATVDQGVQFWNGLAWQSSPIAIDADVIVGPLEEIVYDPVIGNEALAATVNSPTIGNAALAAENVVSLQTTAYVTTIKSDYVDPRDFNGFDRTGNNPVDSIFNSTTNGIIAQSITAGMPVRVPSGLYLIENTVHLTPTAGDSIDFSGADVRPIVDAIWQNTGKYPRTFFKSTMVDRPAFSLNAGLSCRLSGFSIIGPNILSPPAYLVSDKKSNYILPGMRDSQYSPLCGLAIDAFNQVGVPPDGGYPGMSSYYVSGASSDNCYLENVSVTGFVVGIGHNLTGQGSLTDSFTYFRCNVNGCDTCVAVGQAQSKICIFIFGNFGGCRVVFDGSSYGGQQGCPIPVYGLNFGSADHIFDYPSNYGPWYMRNCYAEACRSIGTFGTNGSTARGLASIQEMQFNIKQSTIGPEPPLLVESFGQLDFKNCYIIQDAGSKTAYNIISDIGLAATIENSSFATNGPTGDVVFVGLTPQGSNARLVNCLSEGPYPTMALSDDSTSDISVFSLNNRFSGTIRSSIYNNQTGQTFYQSPNVSGSIVASASAIALTTQAITFSAAIPAGVPLNTPLSGNWTAAQTGWYWVTLNTGQIIALLLTKNSTTVTSAQTVVTTAASTAATVNAIGLTLTAADPTLFQVGDNLFWQMVAQRISQVKRTVLAWLVSNVTGSTVTCTNMFDITAYDTAANNPTTNVTIAQQQWAPTASLTCTTNTSNQLTGVSPTNILHNGDWVNGTGLVANSRVQSGAGTATITLNKATTANASGVNLYFGRLYTPTQTPTW